MTVKDVLQNDNLKERFMNLLKQDLPFALTVGTPGFHHLDFMYDDAGDEFYSSERQQGEYGNSGMLYLGMLKTEKFDPPIKNLDHWANEIFGEDEYNDLCRAEQEECLEAEHESYFDEMLDGELEEILQDIVRDTLYHEENPS